MFKIMHKIRVLCVVHLTAVLARCTSTKMTRSLPKDRAPMHSHSVGKWAQAQKVLLYESMRLAPLAIATVACWLYPASSAAGATIKYVQGNYATPQTAQPTLTLTSTHAQPPATLHLTLLPLKHTP